MGKRPIGREYREVRILDEPLRTDKAILAALTALEGRLMDIERLRKALYELKLPSEGSIHDEVYLKPIEKHLDLQSHPFLDYVLLLLRYHRPGFDDLPHQEKSELIVNACNHANGFLEALHKFVAFLEYGIPGRPLKSAVRDADRDVKAAVLRDVDGLTYRKIGEELGVPTPEDYDYKGDHPVVRQMVKRGQRLLERALGEGGWQEHIEKMKAEAQRRHSLSKVERYTEDWAEALRIPYEEALQLAQKDVQAEEAHIEKLRNSKNRPEKD